MGKCCSKANNELENAPMFENKVSYPGEGDYKNTALRMNTVSSMDDGKSSVETRTSDEINGMDAVKPITGNVDELDLYYKYKLGIFYDNEISMWFRLIFVLDDDIIRKQFMSFYELNLKNMSKEEFQHWCDQKGYPKTRDSYDFYKLLDAFPFSRLLNGLSQKYNVKFHISDLFLFKGKGPFRAITCCANRHTSIDRALNEYENRIKKSKIVYCLNKHWDNHIFPDPTVDNRDRTKDLPFSWPRRFRPDVPELPKWPFDYSKTSPVAFRKLIGDSTTTASENTDVLKSYGVYGLRKPTSRIKFNEITFDESEGQTDIKSVTSNGVRKFFEITDHK